MAIPADLACDMKHEDEQLRRSLVRKGILPDPHHVKGRFHKKGKWPAKELMPSDCWEPAGIDDALDDIARR